MFVGTMPLDHFQISLEVRHGYFGAAAFAFLVIYGLVILFLSRTQYRTPFFCSILLSLQTVKEQAGNSS